MSLEGQWIRICLLLQGTQVRSLAQEDSLALGHLSLCASTTRAHALEPCSETSEVAAMRSLRAAAERAERLRSNNDPAQPKPSKLPLQRSELRKQNQEESLVRISRKSRRGSGLQR